MSREVKEQVKDPTLAEEFEFTLKLVHTQYAVWWEQNTAWSASYGASGRLLLSTGYCEGAMRVHGWHFINGFWEKIDASSN